MVERMRSVFFFFESQRKLKQSEEQGTFREHRVFVCLPLFFFLSCCSSDILFVFQ